MHYLNDNLSPLVKIVLTCLIILEIAVISIKYYSNLPDYITGVILFIAFPTTYYLFQYLRCRYALSQEVGEYNPKKVMVGEELNSNDQVSKLVRQPQYRQYEAKKHRQDGSRQVELSEEDVRREKQRQEQIQNIIEELEEKEGEIFSQ